MIAVRNETSGPAFVLASLLGAYPEKSFQENVDLLLSEVALDADGFRESVRLPLLEVRAKVADLFGTVGGIDDLRSEYIDLFDRGRQLNSLYETEYGRERVMVKGSQLVDVAGFYRAFGFETGGAGVQPEMLDHVAVELEFYALLILKSQILAEKQDREGVEIVLDARKKFLKSHLGRFVGAICDRPGIVASPFYSSVFNYCKNLVLDECERLGVEVEPETWIGGDADTAEVSCGGAVGCVK